MISQSGIKLPEGKTLELRETSDGIIIIENGYSGSFEYFDGRPIDVDIKVGSRREDLTGTDSDAIQVNIV
jgi:hypothetical protein